MVGREVTIVICRDEVELRRIHGMIYASEERFDPDASEWSGARLRVGPRARRLTLVRSQDINLNLTIPEIIQEQLSLFAARRGRLLQARAERRLPEARFRRAMGRDEPRLPQSTDGAPGHQLLLRAARGRRPDRVRPITRRLSATPGLEIAHFMKREDEPGIRTLDRRDECVPRSYVVMDYNYRTPTADLAASLELEGGYAGGVIEYGGHIKTTDEGTALGAHPLGGAGGEPRRVPGRKRSAPDHGRTSVQDGGPPEARRGRGHGRGGRARGDRGIPGDGRARLLPQPLRRRPRLEEHLPAAAHHAATRMPGPHHRDRAADRGGRRCRALCAHRRARSLRHPLPFRYHASRRSGRVAPGAQGRAHGRARLWHALPAAARRRGDHRRSSMAIPTGPSSSAGCTTRSCPRRCAIRMRS